MTDSSHGAAATLPLTDRRTMTERTAQDRPATVTTHPSPCTCSEGELDLSAETPCFELRDVNLHYASHHALCDVSMMIPRRRITAFIGPSGCGKSSLLRCLNRMNDLVDIARVSGEVLLDGQNVYDRAVDVPELRRRVGMVFQKPNPFPKSIYENVAYGLRLQGTRRRSRLDEVVERSLRNAALWDEVKDRLHKPAMSLSGGQQQRLSSPAPSQLNRRSSCWMNPAQRWTPSPRRKLSN